MDDQHGHFILYTSANWAYRGSPNPPHGKTGLSLLSSKLVLTESFTNELIKKNMI